MLKTFLYTFLILNILFIANIRTDYLFAKDEVSGETSIFSLRNPNDSQNEKIMEGFQFNFLAKKDLESKDYNSSILIDYNFRTNISSSDFDKNNLQEFRYDLKGILAEIALGKQVIKWSETFGFNILDIANSKDYSEYVFTDSSHSSIGNWFAKLALKSDNFKADFYYTPLAQNSILPKPGSEYDIYLNKDFSINMPKYKAFTNSEYGFRLNSILFENLDLSLIYFHHYTRIPVLLLNPINFYSIETTTKQENSIGASFSLVAGDWVFRGDFLYTSKTILTEDFIDIFETDHVQSIIGTDRSFESNSTIGIQLNYDDYLSDSFDYNIWAGIKLIQSFFNEKLNFETIYYKGLNNEDCWIRPEIKTYFFDNYFFKLNADIVFNSNALFNKTTKHTSSSQSIQNTSTLKTSTRFFDGYDKADRIYFEFGYLF